uniref:Uncharacterized protein n=1 Tax=Rhizophora mucronata TaxID=61149 RepID=A0A2P2QV41_RHIMU
MKISSLWFEVISHKICGLSCILTLHCSAFSSIDMDIPRALNEFTFAMM